MCNKFYFDLFKKQLFGIEFLDGKQKHIFKFQKSFNFFVVSYDQ